MRCKCDRRCNYTALQTMRGGDRDAVNKSQVPSSVFHAYIIKSDPPRGMIHPRIIIISFSSPGLELMKSCRGIECVGWNYLWIHTFEIFIFFCPAPSAFGCFARILARNENQYAIFELVKRAQREREALFEEVFRQRVLFFRGDKGEIWTLLKLHTHSIWPKRLCFEYSISPTLSFGANRIISISFHYNL